MTDPLRARLAAENYFNAGRCSGHAQFNGRYCRDAAGPEQWCIHCAGFMLLAALDAPPTPSGTTERPACSGCGGPHPFDTTVPSVIWNEIIRAQGLPDYLCLTCIVRAFALAGRSFTADLVGGDGAQYLEFVPIEVIVAGQPSLDAAKISDENTILRVRIRELEAALAALKQNNVQRGRTISDFSVQLKQIPFLKAKLASLAAAVPAEGWRDIPDPGGWRDLRTAPTLEARAEALQRERDGWREDAQRYAQNSEHHQQTADTILILDARSVAKDQRSHGGKCGELVANIITALCDQLQAAALASAQPTPSGTALPADERLMLNAYGRRCYDAGRQSVLAPRPGNDEPATTCDCGAALTVCASCDHEAAGWRDIPDPDGWRDLRTAPTAEDAHIIVITRPGNVYGVHRDGKHWFARNVGRVLLDEDILGWLPLPPASRDQEGTDR